MNKAHRPSSPVTNSRQIILGTNVSSSQWASPATKPDKILEGVITIPVDTWDTDGISKDSRQEWIVGIDKNEHHYHVG